MLPPAIRLVRPINDTPGLAPAGAEPTGDAVINRTPAAMSRSPALVTRRVGAVLAAVVLTATAAAAQAQNGSDLADIGPLRVRDQFLLNMGFLAFEPASSEVLERGHSQMELIETVTNTFAHSSAFTPTLDARSERAPVDLAFLRSAPGNIFYLDGEVYRTALAWRRGVGNDTQLGVSVQVLGFTGGELDGFIEGFHDVFGLGQHGRTGVPRGEYRVYVRSDGREVYRDSSPGLGLGDVVLSSKTLLAPGPRPWQVALDVAVKLPLGDPDELLSSGHTDVGVQLIASRYYQSACVHGAIGVLRLGPHDLLGTPEQFLASGMLAYEQGLSQSLSAIVQLTVSQSPFRSLHLQDLSEVSYQTSLGAKYRFGKNYVLFVALTENLVHFDNTADVGFHLGLSWNFI